VTKTEQSLHQANYFNDKLATKIEQALFDNILVAKTEQKSFT